VPKYDLNRLGAAEFEHLCQSLAIAMIGPGVKVYGMGADGAREATFEGYAPFPSHPGGWTGKWIIQAKFHDVSQIGPAVARRAIVADLDAELETVTQKYKHPCDNYLLFTNVSLTPVFQSGTKDQIDNEIVPKYTDLISNVRVIGSEEISRLLDVHTAIRSTYIDFLVPGDVIAKLLSLITDADERLTEIVQSYASACFSHEGSAALDDAIDVDEKAVALQDVFIDLDVVARQLSVQADDMKNTLPAWMLQACESPDRTSSLSYLLDDSIPSLILIGGPGGGKSTLCQYMAQFHRAHLLGKIDSFSSDSSIRESFLPRSVGHG
jgi:hypothetical protein